MVVNQNLLFPILKNPDFSGNYSASLMQQIKILVMNYTTLLFTFFHLFSFGLFFPQSSLCRYTNDIDIPFDSGFYQYR